MRQYGKRCGRAAHEERLAEAKAAYARVEAMVAAMTTDERQAAAAAGVAAVSRIIGALDKLNDEVEASIATPGNATDVYDRAA